MWASHTISNTAEGDELTAVTVAAHADDCEDTDMETRFV